VGAIYEDQFLASKKRSEFVTYEVSTELACQQMEAETEAEAEENSRIWEHKIR
jgi:hypothetical protein